MKKKLRLVNKMKQVLFLIFMVVPFASAMDYQEPILSTPDEHLKFIKSSLASAKKRVIIVSPFISSWVIDDTEYNGYDGLHKYLSNAISNEIEICVFTDVTIQNNTMKGRKTLSDIGASVTVVSHLHSKNLIIDDDCITFGSFNWLSADTTPQGKFCNYETSVIFRNEQTEKVISKVMCQLKDLEVCYQYCIPAYSLEVSDQEIDCAIELYCEQYNNINYRKLSENTIFRYFMSNFPDLYVSFGMLWKIASIKESGEFINSFLQPILLQCVKASDFVELAEILVKVNKNEQAKEIAKTILGTDRTKEYDNFENIYVRLERIGLSEIGNQFEKYIRGC